MQIVFQDPVASLNPRLRIGEAVREPILVHALATGATVDERVAALLECVGLEQAVAGRYPHELSGGERQRVGIARALSVEPELIVADEPVSALDVSVQAQVLNLLVDLKRSLNLTYLFISHDLRVVRYMSDRIAVMYLGRLVETGGAEEVLRSPLHPYTQTLLAATPTRPPAQPDSAAVSALPIVSASAAEPSAYGCPFLPRCARAEARCRTSRPELAPKGPGRHAACHFA
jgi:oligopeptide/dipeptide ABC transporter ATP-binding protein